MILDEIEEEKDELTVDPQPKRAHRKPRVKNDIFKRPDQDSNELNINVINKKNVSPLAMPKP